MTAHVTDTWQEWKDGYRTGLEAGVRVAEVCAAEPGATAGDVLILLQTLTESSVIQPDPGGFTHHVETPQPPPVCTCRFINQGLPDEVRWRNPECPRHTRP